MIKLLTKLFVKDSENVNDPKVREHYGFMTSITGIFLNIILSAGKILTGVVTGAISIVSDGINNLSDAASSIVTLLGFKFSTKKADKKHPFGHGRMEYFAALTVSIVILLVAVELFKSSFTKILEKQILSYTSKTEFIATICILAASIIVKLWMAVFNKRIGKKIDSVAMDATALDSVSDCVATSVVLICTVLSLFIKNLPIDGYAGIVVSLFIAFTGIKSISETANLLLGSAPDPKLVSDVADYVKNFDKNVIGIHDLMIHDYGPGRLIIILHVEVCAKNDVMEMHDMIDNIERGLEKKYSCIATIHMDPVITDDERVNELKALTKKIVAEIDPAFTIHDFRMNEGGTHGNLIFDVVITHETKLTDEKIIDTIEQKLREYNPKLYAKVTVEYSFV